MKTSSFFRISRPIKIPGCNLLTFDRIKILEVGLSESPRAVLFHHFVNQAHRRFREYTDGRDNNFILAFTHVFEHLQDLILPVDEHVSNATFNKGGRGPAGTGIKHWNILK